MATLTVVAASHALSSGEITGAISPAASVKSVFAVERLKNTMKEIRRAEYPGEFDMKTGRFVVRGLKQGVYDLVILTDQGRIEGVNLRVDGAETSPLGETNIKKLKGLIQRMDEFMNRKKVLFLVGNGREAKALMDLCRDRRHHMGNDVIWRIEIWQFQHMYGAWRLRGHDMKGRKVLLRIKAPAAEINSLRYLFEPRLGGLRIENDKQLSLPPYHIPEDWSKQPGLAPARY